MHPNGLEPGCLSVYASFAYRSIKHRWELHICPVCQMFILQLIEQRDTPPSRLKMLSLMNNLFISKRVPSMILYYVFFVIQPSHS